MWPVPHSSASRTSTTTAPFEICSRTATGSTSSIRLLIWLSTSAPDGLIERNSSKAVGIQYFNEYSGANGASKAPFPGRWNEPKRQMAAQPPRNVSVRPPPPRQPVPPRAPRPPTARRQRPLKPAGRSLVRRGRPVKLDPINLPSSQPCPCCRGERRACNGGYRRG